MHDVHTDLRHHIVLRGRVDGEGADDRISARRQLRHRRLVIGRGDSEGLTALEGHAADKGGGLVLLEDDELVRAGLRGRILALLLVALLLGVTLLLIFGDHVVDRIPRKLDRVRHSLVDVELLHLEASREHGRLEGAATADGLVRIHGGGEAHVDGLLVRLKQRRHALLDELEAGRAAHDLNGREVARGEASSREGLTDRALKAGKEGLRHLHELLEGELAVEIKVVHETLDVDRGLGHTLGAQRLLRLLGGSQQLHAGLGVLPGVKVMLGLELRADPFGDAFVERAAAKVAIIGGALHGKLTGLERDARSGEVCVTEVEEHDVALRLSVEESLSRLEDAKRKGGGSVLVHETKAVESSDVARVNHGLALRVRPVAGHRHDRVHHLGTRRGLRDPHALGEHHGAALLHRHRDVLVIVVHHHAHVASVRHLDAVHTHLGNLLLNLILGELATNEALHVDGGVAVVRAGDGRGLVAHEALLALERHRARILAL
mmetsp:Transcript_14890/g.31229  ORF Transcript_14890/g.31229 Transcript_14890/m.31229 type:complete len:491 (+) Transcript_14890:1438-2910(+)